MQRPTPKQPSVAQQLVEARNVRGILPPTQVLCRARPNACLAQGSVVEVIVALAVHDDCGHRCRLQPAQSRTCSGCRSHVAHSRVQAAARPVRGRLRVGHPPKVAQEKLPSKAQFCKVQCLLEFRVRLGCRMSQGPRSAIRCASRSLSAYWYQY